MTMILSIMSTFIRNILLLHVLFMGLIFRFWSEIEIRYSKWESSRPTIEGHAMNSKNQKDNRLLFVQLFRHCRPDNTFQSIIKNHGILYVQATAPTTTVSS
jgi:hypothetical protein